MVLNRTLRVGWTGGGGGYSGPGDIVGSAIGWWGLRAYNLAKATAHANAVQVKRSSDNATLDIPLATDGSLDLTGVGYTAWAGGSTITVTILYDQVGSAGDMMPPTTGTEPVFTVTGIGTRPTITFTPTQRLRMAGLTTAQPFTRSFMFKQTSDGAGDGDLLGNAGVASAALVSPHSINLQDSGGTPIRVAYTNGNLYAVDSVANTGSSAMCVNGTNTSGALNGDPLNSGFIIMGEQLNGNMPEGGLWGVAFSTQNKADMWTNRQTWYGAGNF